MEKRARTGTHDSREAGEKEKAGRPTSHQPRPTPGSMIDSRAAAENLSLAASFW